MEKEIISSSVASLPKSEIGKTPLDYEIWEEVDGGARLMVTRHTLPTPYSDELISLSVSGVPNERKRVVSEFTAVFGEPIESDLSPDIDDYVEMVSWINKIS